MKKLLVVLLTIAMCALFMAGCGGDSKTANDSDIPCYRVVTEATFPPFDSTDDQGNFVGFDYDLLAAIGEDQGFTFEVTNMEFDALIPALTSDQGDIIAAGMNCDDPARWELVDFSNAYYDSGIVLLVKADNEDINGVEDLKPTDKVASQIGTTASEFAKDLEKEGKIAETVIINEFTACAMQIVNGDVIAATADKPLAEYLVKAYDGKLKIVGEPMDAEGYGFAVQKGNKELLDKINTGLQNMIDNGTYDKLYEKWFNVE